MDEEFTKKQQAFWKKMDTVEFWEKIKSPNYIRTPCNTISHCDNVCQVLIRDYSIKILWDYVKNCVLIQDSANWYHITHTTIKNLTVREVIIGLGYKYMETVWSDNGDDVLDILAHQASLSTVRVLTLDDICEKL